MSWALWKTWSYGRGNWDIWNLVFPSNLKQLLEDMNSVAPGTKINTQKPVVFLYANKVPLEEIKHSLVVQWLRIRLPMPGKAPRVTEGSGHACARNTRSCTPDTGVSPPSAGASHS